MPKTDNRPTITLACNECKRRNYVTVKNRINDRDLTDLVGYLSTLRGVDLTVR